MNKAHVRYLEARLIAEARAIGRIPLENGTNPSLSTMSEADIAKMEVFLDNLLIVLPAVRVDMFIQNVRSATRNAARQTDEALPSPPSPQTHFILETPKHGLKAAAVLTNGEFVVRKGSFTRSEWVGQNGQTASCAPLHAELVRSGVLAPHGERRIFTQDYAFNSPSAAAAVVNGRATNGPAHWKVQGSGLTYKEWEAQSLALPQPEPASTSSFQ